MCKRPSVLQTQGTAVKGDRGAVFEGHGVAEAAVAVRLGRAPATQAGTEDNQCARHRPVFRPKLQVGNDFPSERRSKEAILLREDESAAVQTGEQVQAALGHD